MAKSHLYLLYRETLRKYRKFSSRLSRKLKNGSFHRLTTKEKRKFVNRVERLRRRLEHLRFQLKVAAAAGGLALTLSLTDVQAQTTIGPFVEDKLNNPLRPPVAQEFITSPTLGDVDGDGDLDLIFGDDGGGLTLAINEGSITNPNFQVQTTTAVPFNIDFGVQSHPDLGDFDGDGDMDLLVGESNGAPIRYFRNDAGTFVEGTGVWDPVAKTGNPFNSINTGYGNYKPAFTDFDEDGDLDLFLADDKYYGFNDQIKYFRNAGDGTLTQETGAWDDVAKTGNPLNGVSSNLYFAGIGFADVDNDGDTDIVLGSDSFDSSPTFRPLITYLNDGVGNMSLASSPLNPFDAVTIVSDLDPTFADLDNDGDLDGIVGYRPNGNTLRDTEASILYFENNGDGTFTELEFLDSPFDGVDTDHDSSPTFGDIDGDLDLDVFVGGKEGTIFFYESNSDQTFTRKLGTDNPLDFVNIPSGSSYTKLAVALADVDGDNLLDMHAGDNNNSDMKFYKNNGSGFDANNVANSLNTAISGTIYSQGDYKPALVDFDNDGDLDAFVGQNNSVYGNVLFFRNNDSSPGKTSPAFTEDNGSNPFQSMNIGTSDTFPLPTDIDNDGDLDFFFGSTDGTVIFYENVLGTQTLRTGLDSPFDMVDIGSRAAPTLADYDSDGDLDMFIGNYDGHVDFLENQNVVPAKTLGAPSVIFDPISAPIPLDPGFTLVDDDLYAISARIVITTNFVSGEDDLIFTNQSGITGNYNSSTGVLDLTGHASLANYQTAIQSIQYDNSNPTPTGNRDIDITVVDQDATFDINPVVKTVQLLPPQPPVVTVAGTNLAYSEGSGPVPFDNGATVSDVDNTDLVGGTITISNNYVQGEDVLGFVDQNGITGSFSAPTGVLTLTGPTSVANYEAALQSVTYENTSQNPSLLDRDITVTADDGTNTSTPVVRAVTISPVNNVPVLSPSISTLSYTENQGAVTIDAGLSITDADNSSLQSATVTVGSDYNQGEDILAFVDQLGLTGNFDPATGVLTLTGSGSLTDYQTALRTVTYENTSDNPGAIVKDLDFIVNDGTGPSFQSTVDVDITPVNDAPTLAGTASALVYNPGDGTLAIDNALTVSDVDNTNLVSGSITIGNFQQGEDILSLPTQAGITGVFDANTGIMTLTGTATLADYQTALQQVAFENTNPIPSVLTRAITFELNDGTDNSNQFVRDININFQNSAPVITQPPLEVKQGDPITIDLSTFVSDPEGNLDLSTASVVSQPLSGATATISGNDLTVDYTGLSFFGQDQLDIEICDLLGACTTETLLVDVTPELITVYNALSPNGDGKHDILEIANILDFANNTVTIFNRWGDIVFEVMGYNNSDRAFVGLSDDGNELPSGTYYYSIVPGDGSPIVSGFFMISR